MLKVNSEMVCLFNNLLFIEGVTLLGRTASTKEKQVKSQQ